MPAFVLDSHKYNITVDGQRQVASDLQVHQPMINGDIQIVINPGVAFANAERIEVPEPINWTVTNVPIAGPEDIFTRIDLLYITKVTNDTTSRSREFIDTNRNVYQQVVQIRREDGYNIGIVQGVASPFNITMQNAGEHRPELPIEIRNSAVKLAYIWLKPQTIRIMNNIVAASAPRTGFIEDARTIITPHGHEEFDQGAGI